MVGIIPNFNEFIQKIDEFNFSAKKLEEKIDARFDEMDSKIEGMEDRIAELLVEQNQKMSGLQIDIENLQKVIKERL